MAQLTARGNPRAGAGCGKSAAAAHGWHTERIHVEVSPDRPIPDSQVASLVAQPGGNSYLWKMTVKNGYVTSITGVYRP